MSSLLRTLVFFCFISSSILAVHVETFYGIVNVEEPVLIELIESPAFQRLRHIHQYGVAYYTTHREEFTRYEHSLGVFALLREKGCSLEEQIAGLLHDVSHTIFSHVGDWIFNQQNEENDYQTLTHNDYLDRSGLTNILMKHGIASESILPKEEYFPALEQPLPTLCADRLDYNIQGAFYQGFISREEAKCLFHEIQFRNGDWISNELDLLKKIVRFSIFMSQDCWSSGTNYVLSMWLAEAILRGLDIQALSMNDIRFGVDEEIWNRLLSQEDPLISKNMFMIMHADDYHYYVSEEEADMIIKSKFRGINPFVIVDGKKVRLLTTDPQLSDEFHKAKDRMSKGWAIKLSY